jgi:Flp pilus assembly pilin Flp
MNEVGQGLTEYLVLLMLVSVVSIGAVSMLGKSVRTRIQQAREQIDRIGPSGLQSDR